MMEFLLVAGGVTAGFILAGIFGACKREDNRAHRAMAEEYKRRLNRICSLETPRCSAVVRKAVKIARGQIQ